jgi:Ribosomal RNA adenine dimethylase
MNALHSLSCAFGWWRARVEGKLVPWRLSAVELGDRVLQIGPGFGATTRVLAERLGQLDVLELDERYCERRRSELRARVRVVRGDATRMPYKRARDEVMSMRTEHELRRGASGRATLTRSLTVALSSGGFARNPANAGVLAT